MSQTIKETQEASLNLFQDTTPVVFHPDALAFSPRVLTRGAKWPTLPARADTTHAAPVPIETTAPNPTTLEAVRSGKINSNVTRPTDLQTVLPSMPVNPDSDVTLVASIEGSNGDSYYV